MLLTAQKATAHSEKILQFLLTSLLGNDTKALKKYFTSLRDVSLRKSTLWYHRVAKQCYQLRTHLQGVGPLATSFCYFTQTQDSDLKKNLFHNIHNKYLSNRFTIDYARIQSDIRPLHDTARPRQRWYYIIYTRSSSYQLSVAMDSYQT
jgi:hypothetical protein